MNEVQKCKEGLSDFDGFILDEDQLIPTAQETWAGIKVVADAIIQRFQNRLHSSTTRQVVGDSSNHPKQYRFGDGTPGSCYDIRHACKRWVVSKARYRDFNQHSNNFKSPASMRKFRWIQENESLCKTVPIFMREQCKFIEYFLL